MDLGLYCPYVICTCSGQIKCDVIATHVNQSCFNTCTYQGYITRSWARNSQQQNREDAGLHGI